MHLPQAQREALILVGAGGLAYEEAAEICDCAVGTIKSRVARGRVALETLLNEGKLPSRRTHKTRDGETALQAIMGEVAETQPRALALREFAREACPIRRAPPLARRRRGAMPG